VLDGHATGTFTGKLLVRQKAQQTNAFQSNKNLLLSDNASVNSMPQLEIFADDVKCSHGATSGQLDNTALFYLETRGLDKAKATQLLTRAFANDVILKNNNDIPVLVRPILQHFKFGNDLILRFKYRFVLHHFQYRHKITFFKTYLQTFLLQPRACLSPLLYYKMPEKP